MTEAAYQGAPGAFSEDAAHALLGADAVLLPCWRFEDVFDAVESERARFGVLPVENTLAGSVQPAYDLLAARSLRIVGETVIRIGHALVATPGAKLQELRQVLSHPVALAQCEGFFRSHPSLEPVSVYDTAGAVAQVVKRGAHDQAAIASRRAAAVHGGVVLQDGLEDHPENYTRFLLLAREGTPTPPGAEYKTSLVLTVAHRPGALHQSLGHFAGRGIDLSKIESRPRRGKPFEYVFYLDLAGREDEPRVVEALEDLKRTTLDLRVLGSYPRCR